MAVSDIIDLMDDYFERLVLESPVPALVLFYDRSVSPFLTSHISHCMQFFALEFYGLVDLYRMDLNLSFAPKQCGNVSTPSVFFFVNGEIVRTVTKQQLEHESAESDRIFAESQPAGLKRTRGSLKRLLGEAVMARLHEAVGVPAVTPRVRARQQEPPGPRMSTEQIKAKLIELDGLICQGCDRTFDDPRYLEVDHIVPRADGGIDHISNRVLLCRPCNGIKSDRFTLSGLRRENVRLGRMARK